MAQVLDIVYFDVCICVHLFVVTASVSTRKTTPPTPTTAVATTGQNVVYK